MLFVKKFKNLQFWLDIKTRNNKANCIKDKPKIWRREILIRRTTNYLLEVSNRINQVDGKERKEQKLVFLKNELSSDDTSLRKEITIQPGIDVKNAKGDGDRSGESLKDNSKIDDRMKIDSHGINQMYTKLYYMCMLHIFFNITLLISQDKFDNNLSKI